MTEDNMSTIDIQENQLLKLDKELLAILLQDKSTGRNIIWASDNYKKHGPEYSADRQLLVPLITGHHWNIIRPRTAKS
ncbi:MAG: restriction endonuclease subunit M, partial [Treponema sp.]|nr:restriction endonuclease subunit M [Treponema sp.]